MPINPVSGVGNSADPREAVQQWPAAASGSRASATASELTPEEKERVEELAKRDREVREHEQAHMAAAGPYARGVPTYHYVTGPDHRQYAVSGEVRLEISPISGNPDATIRKMEQIRRAAMAPGDPSGQDQKVAAEAAAQEAKAIKDKTSRTTGQPSAQRNAVLREDPAPENTGAPSVNMLA